MNLQDKLRVKSPFEIVHTIHGDMKVGDLERKTIEFENDNELTYAIEYHLDSEMVHRSVHIQLKEGSEAAAIAACF